MENQGTDKLCEALSKAQLKFKVPKKNKTVDFTHNGKRTFYKYADLQDCIEAIREPLAENGLAIVSQISINESDKCDLITTLLHSSGQSISTTFPLPAAGSDQKIFGAALTYARRYSLSPLVGIASEEDTDAADPDPNHKRPEPKQVVKGEEKPKPTMPKFSSVIEEFRYKSQKLLNWKQPQFEEACLKTGVELKDLNTMTEDEVRKLIQFVDLKI